VTNFIIYSYAANGASSTSDGAILNIVSPVGTISNFADLSLEISRVDVTLVDPISSPILSCVNLKGS
jgi:hypothetical protein